MNPIAANIKPIIILVKESNEEASKGSWGWSCCVSFVDSVFSCSTLLYSLTLFAPFNNSSAWYNKNK